jgi:hypothetical protein
MLEKTEGHSKMNNPDKLETLGTQDTGRRETKQKHKKWPSVFSNIYSEITCLFPTDNFNHMLIHMCLLLQLVSNKAKTQDRKLKQ